MAGGKGLRGLLQVPGPLGTAECCPGWQRGTRGLHSTVDVSGSSLCDRCDDLLGGRVDHFGAAGPLRSNPLATDVEGGAVKGFPVARRLISCRRRHLRLLPARGTGWRAPRSCRHLLSRASSAHSVTAVAQVAQGALRSGCMMDWRQSTDNKFVGRSCRAEARRAPPQGRNTSRP